MLIQGIKKNEKKGAKINTVEQFNSVGRKASNSWGTIPRRPFMNPYAVK